MARLKRNWQILWNTKDGYVVVKLPSGDHQTEHRAVAEEILGRPLVGGEHVHHINGRKDDNRPENLCVMDEEDHLAFHNWFNWILKTYQVKPRLETQLERLRERFNGTILSDVLDKTGS